MALFYSAVNVINDVELNVGDNAGYQKMKLIGHAVTSVQADGHELEAIRNQFTGIPMHNGRVVEWRGETAAFIAMHLKA